MFTNRFPPGTELSSDVMQNYLSKLHSYVVKLLLTPTNRISNGVETTNDIILDSTTKGVVLKSANGHYWRSTISNAGVLTWTDLGTTKP
jgi:hypothetical protein